MTTIKLAGPIDLEKLYDVCAGISATVRVEVDDNSLLLTLAGEEAAGCAELLAEWLSVEGAVVVRLIG